MKKILLISLAVFILVLAIYLLFYVFQNSPNLDDVFPPVVGTRVDLSANPFGVHLGAKDIIWQHSEIAQELIKKTPELGAGWIRVHFYWPSIEKSKGVYDWRMTDDIVDETGQLELELLVNIHGYPEFTLYNEEKKISRYNEFIKSLARRYKDKIAYWEIENEVLAENSGFGTGKIDEFNRILQTADETIKKENPSAKIVLSGFGSSKLDLILYSDKKVQKSRQEIVDLFKLTENYYDILDVHLYHNPDDTGKKIDLIHELMREAGYAIIKPIWISETAGPDLRYWDPDFENDADDDSNDFPKNQPERELTQRMITSLSYGREKVERMAWHKYWQRNERVDNLMYTGLINAELEPTNLFKAYKHLINELKGAREMEKINLGEDIIAFHFIKSGRDVYALWSTDANKTIKKNLGLDKIEKIYITDPAGNEIKKTKEILIGAAPIFIEAPR